MDPPLQNFIRLLSGLRRRPVPSVEIDHSDARGKRTSTCRSPMEPEADSMRTLNKDGFLDCNVRLPSPRSSLSSRNSLSRLCCVSRILPCGTPTDLGEWKSIEGLDVALNEGTDGNTTGDRPWHT